MCKFWHGLGVPKTYFASKMVATWPQVQEFVSDIWTEYCGLGPSPWLEAGPCTSLKFLISSETWSGKPESGIQIYITLYNLNFEFHPALNL